MSCLGRQPASVSLRARAVATLGREARSWPPALATSLLLAPVGVFCRGPVPFLEMPAVCHPDLGSTAEATSAWRGAEERPPKNPFALTLPKSSPPGPRNFLCPTLFAPGGHLSGAITLLVWQVQERRFPRVCSLHLLFQQVSERGANSENCRGSSSSCAVSPAYQSAIRALTRRGSTTGSSRRPRGGQHC